MLGESPTRPNSGTELCRRDSLRLQTAHEQRHALLCLRWGFTSPSCGRVSLHKLTESSHAPSVTSKVSPPSRLSL